MKREENNLARSKMLDDPKLWFNSASYKIWKQGDLERKARRKGRIRNGRS